jgi:hypothetical protein
MPLWARLFVLLVGMLAWLAMVGVSLWLKEIPSAVLIGFPAALWLALSGGDSISRKRASSRAAKTITKDDRG